MGQPSPFSLTVEIGHVHSIEKGSGAEHGRAWSSCILNIPIEDLRRNLHKYLMFGEGTENLPPILEALRARETRASCTSSCAAMAT
jgi:hypothetical protein